MKVYYIYSTLYKAYYIVFQNQTVLSIFISRKIKSSIQHNPEVTVSISYVFLEKQLTLKKTYFLKSIPEVEDSLFYFIYYQS